MTSPAPQAFTPNFFIKIVGGPNKGEVYRINPPGLIVGRDPGGSQITLFDARVSRQQCRIDFIEDAILLEDLSGKGSTLVNDVPASGQQELRHGDRLNMGDSVLVFEVASASPKLAVVPPLDPAQTPRPAQLPGSVSGGFSTGPAPASSPNRMRFLIIAVGVIAGAVLYLMPDKKVAGKPMKVGQDLNVAIEEVQKRQKEIEKPRANLTDQDLYNRRSAQKHFIRGIRDYQNGKYSRAIEAFQTTLATDPSNSLARRYYRLADKKRMDLVDQHMDLGNKYFEKSMYKMCISEFEKVLQIINLPSHKKYQLAKEQIKECRLALQGGR